MLKMKLYKLTDREIEDIAGVFSDHIFGNGEKGLYYLCKSRDERKAFVTGYINYLLTGARFFTVSRKKEGYICLQTQTGRASLKGKVAFVSGIVKSMGIPGALRFGIDFIKAGKPIEKLLRSEGYVHIRLLAVRKEYQGQGYMKKLIDIAFDQAKKKNVPCIVSTDSMEKAERYERYGFRLFRKRHLSDSATEYDMIWRNT